MRITFCLEMPAVRLGRRVAGDEFSRQNKKLLWLLEAMIKCNLIYLASHPAPQLYDSGVRYRREPVGQEEWWDIPTILRAGYGDCEDLSAWRVAELRARGIQAKCHLKWMHSAKRQLALYHVQVLQPNGVIEDPSKRLGMKGRE